ncbi:SLOG family protein [Chryseobacterium sp. T1]
MKNLVKRLFYFNGHILTLSHITIVSKSNIMNIAIVGARDFEDYEIRKTTLNSYIENKICVSSIVSGGAKGADTLAKRYAEDL